MNVHSGNPCGSTSFPHPPGLHGVSHCLSQSLWQVPPRRPPLPLIPHRRQWALKNQNAPGAAHCHVRRWPHAYPWGLSVPSTLPPRNREAQGVGRTGEKKRRQHRREGGDVGEGFVSSEPKRLPSHRTARALRSQSPGTRPVPPNPTTMETRGHQVLKLAHRIRGLLHDHNDPADAGAVAFYCKRGFQLDRHGG